MENKDQLSITLPKKEKPEIKPLSNRVSSIFSISQKKLEEKKQIELKEEAKREAEKNIKIQMKKAYSHKKSTGESSFMRLLKKKQTCPEVDYIVSQAEEFDDSVPLEGFGERTLRLQGWKPGTDLGNT